MTSQPAVSETKWLLVHLFQMDPSVNFGLPNFRFGIDSSLADALQCPTEEVGMGSSARSPASLTPTNPQLPACPGVPLRVGTQLLAVGQLPSLLPTLPESAQELSQREPHSSS